MSGDFDSKRDSHPIKFEQRSQILVKLSSLRPFDNTAISLSQK